MSCAVINVQTGWKSNAGFKSILLDKCASAVLDCFRNLCEAHARLDILPSMLSDKPVDLCCFPDVLICSLWVFAHPLFIIAFLFRSDPPCIASANKVWKSSEKFMARTHPCTAAVRLLDKFRLERTLTPELVEGLSVPAFSSSAFSSSSFSWFRLESSLEPVASIQLEYKPDAAASTSSSTSSSRSSGTLAGSGGISEVMMEVVDKEVPCTWVDGLSQPNIPPTSEEICAICYADIRGIFGWKNRRKKWPTAHPQWYRKYDNDPLVSTPSSNFASCPR